MPDTITKLTYQTFQQSKIYFALAHKRISTQLRNFIHPNLKLNTKSLSAEILQKMQQRIDKIIEKDLADGEKGIYPVNIIFDNPWADFFSYYPNVWLDMPSVWEKIQQKKYQEFSQEIDTQDYPNYYKISIIKQMDT
ncbi:ubiquinone biosynthesis protein UbiE [Dapis sp. BLCC M126]|uniref:ubiquinone biosynthesis protein UbiE n=1 Tax=Dapis sp. BLCC M126 TaxID=3400189 RepID=UPI003CF79501